MDAPIILGAAGFILATGTSVVSIAVYAARTRAMTETTALGLADLDSDTSHKLRNLDNFRLALPDHLNANFARKETIAVELNAIKSQLDRIEKHGEMMARRMMGGGTGV